MKRLLLCLILVACSDDDPVAPSNSSTSGSGSHQCGSNETDRVGAKCKDGTNSTATGSGACSSHGGVSYWICQ
jgi:hypothetical protein